MLGGRHPLPSKICTQKWPTPLKSTDFNKYLLITSQTVRASEICWSSVNRKSTMGFPTSYRWSSYVTPNSPKGGSKSEFVIYISATDEAGDFKFGTQLRFTKAHHKITPRGKRGRGPGLGELPKILGFPFNISVTAEASDFKLCMPLWFLKAHHKITPTGKVCVALG